MASRTNSLGLVIVLVLVAIGLALWWSVPGDGPEPEPEPLDGRSPEDARSYRAEFEAIAENLEANGPVRLARRVIEKRLSKVIDPELPALRRIKIGSGMTRTLLVEGRIEDAKELIAKIFDLVTAEQKGVPPNADFHALRALVYLRDAEVQNCIARHNADCCIFPLQGSAIHSDKEPARRAREYYLEALRQSPGDLRSLWLLNLTSMAIGDHPDGVPLRFRIPPGAFESEHEVGRFRDIAPDLGVDTFNRCGGTIVEDFDGDGSLDIVTSTLDPMGPVTYYQRSSTGGFEDRSTVSRLDDQLGGLNCVGADYDDDGDVDVLILRGAWWYDSGRIRNSLLRHEPDGTFTDVTEAAGLAQPAYPTQAAVWADLDSDGDLDLYIGNESGADQAPPRSDHPSQLFRNNGNGTFTDIAAAAGVTNDRYAKGVTAGDYDNDGDMDLYVSNAAANRLYRNDGNMKFTDVAPELGVTEPAGISFATWFFDYDNDGHLDLFVAAYDAKISDVALDYLRRPHRATIPALYHNNGDGTFTNVAKQANLDHPYLPMGANFGDLDNDGWLDMYLTTGEPDYETLMPNVMLRNDGGVRFQDVTKSGGFGHLQKGHGIAFADLDNDGDQDIYHQLGGFYRGDAYHNALFLNPGHGNRFLHIRLVGKKSNRMGNGVRSKVVVTTAAGAREIQREIHRAVGSVSSFGGSPMRQEIGLGKATAIRSLEIAWPVSGTKQVFENVPLDSVIRVVEDASTFEVLDVPRLSLDAASRVGPKD